VPKIVIGKEVSEQIPIFENRIDRAAEKTGFAANLPYGPAIVLSVTADNERFELHCNDPTTSFALILGGRSRPGLSAIARRAEEERTKRKVAPHFSVGFSFQ
jgi:hypothetical protein